MTANKHDALYDACLASAAEAQRAYEAPIRIAEAIRDAYSDAFGRPAPDSWQEALRALEAAARTAMFIAGAVELPPERVAPLGEPGPVACPDVWEAL